MDQSLKRCAWVGDDPLYVTYHDQEWGVPTRDDKTQFEFLTLESAQAGLSWITILKRREGYKRVFPELTYYNGAARYGKESGRKMTAMLRSLGMPRDWSLVFHCLRHNLNNALARGSEAHLAGMDSKLRLYIRYSIVGHELPDDVNARHYTETSAAEKALLMNGVNFDLPEIASFDVYDGVIRVEAALAKKIGDRRGREDMGPSRVKI